MRRNPFAPDVPCHRVVAADLQLGGFSGSWVSVGVLVGRWDWQQ
jgi:methylated-DNA-[protein]-cysteine S-methyltransferase